MQSTEPTGAIFGPTVRGVDLAQLLSDPAFVRPALERMTQCHRCHACSLDRLMPD
jgi:hypothetical protein